MRAPLKVESTTYHELNDAEDERKYSWWLTFLLLASILILGTVFFVVMNNNKGTMKVIEEAQLGKSVSISAEAKVGDYAEETAAAKQKDGNNEESVAGRIDICNGHGTESLWIPGTCHCNSGWSPPRCATEIDLSKKGNHFRVFRPSSTAGRIDICNGHGTPRGTRGRCHCNSGWSPPRCAGRRFG